MRPAASSPSRISSSAASPVSRQPPALGREQHDRGAVRRRDVPRVGLRDDRGARRERRDESLVVGVLRGERGGEIGACMDPGARRRPRGGGLDRAVRLDRLEPRLPVLAQALEVLLGRPDDGEAHLAEPLHVGWAAGSTRSPKAVFRGIGVSSSTRRSSAPSGMLSARPSSASSSSVAGRSRVDESSGAVRRRRSRGRRPPRSRPPRPRAGRARRCARARRSRAAVSCAAPGSPVVPLRDLVVVDGPPPRGSRARGSRRCGPRPRGSRRRGRRAFRARQALQRAPRLRLEAPDRPPSISAWWPSLEDRRRQSPSSEWKTRSLTVTRPACPRRTAPPPPCTWPRRSSRSRCRCARRRAPGAASTSCA